jgi:glycosyltransferase involved in cell wall biosynthesis
VARRLGVPLVLDAPNVEAARFRSTGARSWPLVSLYERFVTRIASRVFVVSEEDRRRFADRGVAASKMVLVPNGVDPDVMHPDAAVRAAMRRELGVDEGTRLLLFFGQLEYAPNREALAVIAGEILPRLDASGAAYRLIVAGKGSAGAVAAHPRARVLGTVPSVAPYINAADAVLAPIMSGGGTRLKILESIACGTPVVSTTAGAEGIDRGACGDLLAICDGWDEFAARLMAEEPVKAGNVPNGFVDMYSWAHIVKRIEWPQARRRTGST